MRVFNHSTQVMSVNGDAVAHHELFLPSGFDGTVTIGGSDLVFPDYCESVLVIDDGAGLEIWYEEMPVPYVFWAGVFMITLGATAFFLRLVQKIRTMS